jgi:hypothetical protein
MQEAANNARLQTQNADIMTHAMTAEAVPDTILLPVQEEDDDTDGNSIASFSAEPPVSTKKSICFDAAEAADGSVPDKSKSKKRSSKESKASTESPKRSSSDSKTASDSKSKRTKR